MQTALQNVPGNKREDLLGAHHGAIAEQFVGQELLAMSDPYWNTRLHFWEREKKSSSAEIDYVINIRGHVVPIEVKAGATGRLRSLKQFLMEKKVDIGVRISEAALQFDGEILSVPLYLIDQLPRIMEDLEK